MFFGTIQDIGYFYTRITQILFCGWVDWCKDSAILSWPLCKDNACVANVGFGIIILEGIVDYALNVMLLVQLDGRRVVIVSSWGGV